MQRDDGTAVRTRSLDALADIAVHRGDQLRRRRRQLRAVPAAVLAVVMLVGVVRLGHDGKVSTVDTRPADRVEEDREDRAPTDTRTGDDASAGSHVDAGAAPGVDRPDVAPGPDVASPDKVTGRVDVGRPNVLYVSGPAGGGQAALWQLDRQSGARVRRGDADLCRPSVSPADGSIAYCKQGAIVVRDLDGGGDHTVVASQATDPDFAPSGKRLAYVDRSNGREVIWTVGVDGSDRRRLWKDTNDERYPTWSPDGSKVAFVRGASGSSVSRSVWIVAADGSSPRELARFNGLDAYPIDWSPDGRRLAFTCLPSLGRSVRDTEAAGIAVCLFDLATGQWHAITPERVQATSPNWSPDGSEIAFTAHPGTTSATSEVWVMRSDGTEERQLGPGGTGDDPAWYPVFLPNRPT